MLTVSGQASIAFGIPGTPFAASYTFEAGYNIDTEGDSGLFYNIDPEGGSKAKKGIDVHANAGASLTKYGRAHEVYKSAGTCRAN